MKNALWFLLGIIGGFVAAHVMNKDPRGHELLAEVDSRIGEFADRMTDAYHSQEAKFSGAGDVFDAAKSAVSEALSNAKDAASAAADAVSDAASDAADGAEDAVTTVKKAAKKAAN